MGTPAQNPTGYAVSSVVEEARALNLSTGPHFLLCFGSTDDNVRLAQPVPCPPSPVTPLCLFWLAALRSPFPTARPSSWLSGSECWVRAQVTGGTQGQHTPVPPSLHGGWTRIA